MRRPLTLVVLGLVALLLQGGIATHVPRAFVPDLAFLIVVTCGIHVPSARGLLAAAWLGRARLIDNVALRNQLGTHDSIALS